ncbi:response regulator [Myxococcota bacterium]|nr:response regulator [Myxococcota bacterium]MBU1379835.1 response regulator [Myxococcota bacterium]MBU1495953.1 response regulator [Myxococcota bacterium]
MARFLNRSDIRFWLFLFLVSVVGCVAIAWLIIGNAYKNEVNQIRQRAGESARLLSHKVHQLGARQIQEYLESDFADSKLYSYVTVLDENGKSLAHSDKARQYMTFPALALKKGAPFVRVDKIYTRDKHDASSKFHGEKTLNVMIPVKLKRDGSIRTINVGISLRNLDRIYRKYLKLMLFLVPLFFFFVFLPPMIRTVKIRNQAEIIAKNNENMNILLNSTQNFIWYFLDPQTLGAVNKAAAGFWGKDVHAIEGAKLNKILPETYASDLSRKLEVIFKNGEVVKHETEQKNSNGELRLLSVNCYPKKNSNGIVEYVVCSAQDITEARELEKKFLHAQKMETVGLFTNAIAHDFNNIITGITGNLELAYEDFTVGEDITEYCNEIKTSLRMGSDLTGQLLTFSRKQNTKNTSLDFFRLIRELKNFVQRLIGEDVSVSFSVPDDSATFCGDPNRIEQVIMNLAVNAKDAMPGGGKFTLKVCTLELEDEFYSRHSDMNGKLFVLMTVSDTGCGMEPEVAERIFEPFFTTKPVGRGTGLGLSTVYTIVRSYDGFIEVVSEVGKGTTFRIYLPLGEDSVPEPVQSMANEVTSEKAELSVTGSTAHINQAGANQGDKLAVKAPAPASLKYRNTILIVDDEPVVRKIAARILEKNNYSVIEVTTGELALDILMDDKNKIDLMITDINLPGINGLELGQKAKDMRRNLRIIYSSGYSKQTDILIDSGILDSEFLPKPYTPRQLLEKIL